MKRLSLFVITALLLIACGKGKKKMIGQDAVDISDFIEFFDEIKLPVTITDSLLKAKVNDSTRISDTVFTQFVSDTVLKPIYGKHKPKIYAVGRFRNGKDAETYLLIKAKGNSINTAYALAFTPENKFSAAMVLMTDAKKSPGTDRAVIDSKYTFNLVDQYKSDDGSTSEFSQVYGYNDAGVFMMLMQDGLPQGEQMPILNPIDTLPMTHKLSGDYGKDKRNFITIRDGKSEKEFLFFINMDKGSGSDCQAEVKGEAQIVGKDSAVYFTKSDPCVIGFKFSSRGIRITESTVCGNKRPAGCSFNASYPRLKSPLKEKKNEGHKK